MKKLTETLLDASLFLAVSAGLLYLMGWIYLDTFFTALDVPVRALDLRPEEVILYGSLSAITVALVVAFASLISAYALLLFFNDNANRKGKFWTSLHKGKLDILTILAALVILIGFPMLVKYMEHLALEQAAGFVGGRCLKTSVFHSNSESDGAIETSGCFIVRSQEMVWLKQLSVDQLPSTKNIAIPVSAIKSIETEPLLP